MKDANQRPVLDESARYQIKVWGRLNEKWSDWFNGMTLAFENSITTLTGAVADQAKLRGILSKIWDLNMTVISVSRIESDKDNLQQGGK